MVGIFLANGFEEIEAVSTIDILRRGDVEVLLIGVDGKIAKGANGIEILCEKQLDEVDFGFLEMLILPGGLDGTKTLCKNAKVQEVLKSFASSNKKLAAICAAPLALDKAGVLKGKFTCYVGMQDEFSNQAYTGENVTKSKNIITSKGPATASEFGFALLEDLKGERKALEIKQGMLFP